MRSAPAPATTREERPARPTRPVLTGEKKMGMMKFAGIAGLALLISACGSEAPKQEEAKADEEPETLPAGLYEVSSEVVTLASTDKTTPKTTLKQGDKATARACVAEGGKLDPALLAEGDDKCEVKNSYIHYGRM